MEDNTKEEKTVGRQYLIRSADVASGNASTGRIDLSFIIKKGHYRIVSLTTINNNASVLKFCLSIDQCTGNRIRSSKSTSDNLFNAIVPNNVAASAKLVHYYSDTEATLYFNNSTRSITYTWYDSSGTALSLGAEWEMHLLKID